MKAAKVLLALGGLALTSAANGVQPQVAPAAPRVEAPPYSGSDAATRRAAIEEAVRLLVLQPGYFQAVRDPHERTAVTEDMEHRLAELGIRAEIGECEWMGLVAQGTARGNRFYGAACRVRIGGQAERYLLLCSVLYGGITLAELDSFAYDSEYLFIRRACF
jgi:hypothetical protein